MADRNTGKTSTVAAKNVRKSSPNGTSPGPASATSTPTRAMCRARRCGGAEGAVGSHRDAGPENVLVHSEGTVLLVSNTLLLLDLDVTTRNGCARGCGTGVVNTPRPAAHAVLCCPTSEPRKPMLFMHSNCNYMLAALRVLIVGQCKHSFSQRKNAMVKQNHRHNMVDLSPLCDIVMCSFAIKVRGLLYWFLGAFTVVAKSFTHRPPRAAALVVSTASPATASLASNLRSSSVGPHGTMPPGLSGNNWR